MYGDQQPSILRSPQAPTSAGPEAIALAAEFGLHLDPWQQLVLTEVLKENSDGKWAAFEVGLMVSRQNGKGSCLEAIELAGLFLFGERLIIHCLAIDTPVLTRDSGWKVISELTEEDWVFHPSGQPVRVLGKSPVWLDQHCYRVITTDGREVIADADHLWTVIDRQRGTGSRQADGEFFKTATMTTKEMYESGVTRYPNRSVPGPRFGLPRQHAIDLPDRQLPIDPYVLGAWLGDGTSAHSELTSHVNDVPYWRHAFMECGVETSQHSCANRIGLLSGTWRKLNDLGLIRNKHVPENYLLASARQRESLLQGLMDTDGSISNGRAAFVNTNRQVAESVLFLARSLGWRAVLSQSDGSHSGFRATKPQYKVQWTPKVGDPYTPVRMPRKVAKIKSPSTYFTKDGRFTISIESIEPVTSVPVSCITVDSADGLFLAGDGLLVTHNSAHQFKTSKEAMRRLEFLLKTSGQKYKPNRSHGEESLELLAGPNAGARVMFQTRTKAGGLGLSGDRVILDEAMIVSSEAIQALMPTLSARPNPQILYTGSAVDRRIHPHCEAFTGIRQRALSNDPGRLCYIEWSCDPSADPTSPRERARANPGQGYRITPEYIEDEYRSFRGMGDVRAFGVQRLGIGDWPTLGDARSEIPAEKWGAMHTPAPDLVGKRVLVLCRAPEGGPWAIVGAQRLSDGRIHLEVGYVGDDTADEVMRKLVDVIAAWDPLALIVGRHVDARTELETAGVDVTVPTRTEEAQACGGFLNDVLVDAVPPLLSHSNDPGLNNATRQAIKHELSAGGFVWEAVEGRSYAQLMGATLARWGLVKFGGESRPEPTVHEWPTDKEVQAWLEEDDEEILEDAEDKYPAEYPPMPGNIGAFS